ncbi:ABC transporter [Hysterangium stoloniferum]|nr:ABC transporter [Hysterangium stoloniferum]
MPVLEKSSSVQDDIIVNADGTQESIIGNEKEGDSIQAPILLKYDEVPWYKRVPFTKTTDIPPPRPSLDDAPMIPEESASIFSLITFSWITSMLSLGYARPLEPTDLWKLQDRRSSAFISSKILASFQKRAKVAEGYNTKLAKGEIGPGVRKIWWSLRGNRAEREKKWREKDGRKKPSLTLAMNDSVAWWFWSAGILKVIGDTSQVTSPLVVKAIINFATESFTAHRSGKQAPPVGKGIGLAFGLLFLQLLTSACTHQFFYRSASTGVLIRGGLIHAVYSRSLRLTSRARSTLTNGRLVNHISTDISRIDFCAGFFHMFWAAPIQLIICLALLLVNLGPSALAGFAIFFIGTPLQTRVMRNLFAIRKKSMVFTDKRAKLLQELLGNMRIIKLFAWEEPFLEKISQLRNGEIKGIRSLLLIRAANNAAAISMPTLAAVLSFVVYSLTGHALEPGILFSSLTLFNLLRMPLLFLPLSASSIADAMNAIGRLDEAFTAEVLTETKVIDESLPCAIKVDHADFVWDGVPPDLEESNKSKKRGKPAEPSSQAEPGNAGAEHAFKIKDVSLTIPRGQLCAIVGPVGSGKSSLLQGLIGEMRREAGTVQFGGSVGYCQQRAWIQNATIRENICFGRPFEEERYWAAVRDSCLGPDLDMFPHGDSTEVGEKGISLSGGQKQRLGICRALYCDTDIQIFDDPLSALDAHVGKTVFQNVFQTALQGKTRILVTHALHFLPQVDYIITMLDGRIVERGTYKELLENNGAFAKFIHEFGAKEEAEEAGEKVAKEDMTKRKTMVGGGIMQAEERSTGAVSGAIYAAYFRAGRGRIILPILFISVMFLQGVQVMTSYWLVYWQERKWNKSQGFYMGIYAGLGLGQTTSIFLMGSSFAALSYFASKQLHRDMTRRIIHAPMSFFDTTPLGRIMNRFSKDIDTVDNLLGDSFRFMCTTLASITGAIILIAIILPYFLVPVAVISVVYVYAALFYRSSARELKRLDAILRSAMYSHFSESLSGLATIRAYGESERFLLENERRTDHENRAYWLTVCNQRWLGIRLDFLGVMLTFAVSILTVAARFTISPAQTGVTLSYILTVQQAFQFAVRQSAEVENNMNGVERVVYYANEIEQDPDYHRPENTPPSVWPAEGGIELKDVVMSYRPELPSVLKGLTMSVRGGDKIGIVGRTGAGKSSIMTALFRLVELKSGSIHIDGVDISGLGLMDLRSRLSMIPQDPVLFNGTIRTNLDPFGLHDDARLWDALKRVYLVEPEKVGEVEEDSQNKFTLDTPVEDEGANLSVGQRSLVSLARALVKDSKILILDEATASVDFETDAKIQDTIAEAFADRTILCIAHRLKTIIGYDKICVVDAGRIAEYDTPMKLYDAGGIFRGMCDRSSITPDDIRLAIKEREDMMHDI